MPIELHIRDDAGNLRILPLQKAVTIGRSPECDILSTDPEVSWRHCTLWVEHGMPWIRDLESRNGTLVGGQPIGRATPLHDGATIQIGSLQAQVRGVGALPSPGPDRALALVDLGTGLQHPLRSDRFVIADHDDADLRVEGADATLIVHPEGEVWLDDEEVPLEQERQLGALRFLLRAIASEVYQSTLDASNDRYPYQLTVDLNGQTGPLAEVHDPVSGAHHGIDATNRAVLLYVLARKWCEDQQSELPRAKRGWCADDDLIVGVWGRAGLADGAGKLKALLHRIRSELRDAGFDPWFIEKKRGFTRVRVSQATA